ncbi:MAG TPA: DUF1080 domain-containing protein [Lacipirellula sp.]
MTHSHQKFRPGRIVLPLMAALAIGALGGRMAAAAEAALAQNTPAKKAKAKNDKQGAGFVKLFEGDKDKTWVGYNKDAWPEGWELKDGILHRTGSGGDLQTVEEYGDFDLRFGWKVSEGGNSGVMYRVSREKGPAYETGPEYQILDNARHRDGGSPLTSSASLYALYAPSKDVVKPAGKWNKARIVVRGNRIQHYLNGEKVVDAEIGSDDWNKRLAESKFATWPKFAKNQRGFIVLQDHGDEVWFRNMRVKRLDNAGDSGAGK